MISKDSQSGSIIFYILLAVVLFGALGFAVAHMIRGNPGNITNEKSGLYADEILDYARKIKQSVQNLLISNSCDPANISFANAVVTGYGHTPAEPDRCKIYHADGGGMTWVQPSSQITSHAYFYTGDLVVSDLGSDSNAELVMVLRGVNSDVCAAINRKLSLATPAQDDMPDTKFFTEKFTGTYTDSDALGSNVGGGSAVYDNQPAGCFYEADASSGEYFFYQVLIPR